MSDSTTTTRLLPQRRLNRFSILDNEPVHVWAVAHSDRGQLSSQFHLTERVAEQVAALAEFSVAPITALASLRELNSATRERLRRLALFGHDSRLVITDVEPVDGRIMSDKPFALRVHFASSPLHPPRLVSVRVEWVGEPFIVERLVNPGDLTLRYVDVQFDERQTLPTGAATFRVSLWNKAGSEAKFRTTCAVLPSNPFALNLGPSGDFVTGTWSARGVRHGDAYDTGIAATLSNGDGSPVGVHTQFVWKFWGSGVGSYIVEQGTGNFGGSITVPAHNTWGGWISFHSPNGSGIYGFYNSKKDMTIEIQMTTNDGRTVSGSITARTMFQFGINITAVAGEDFTGQEWADLDTAAGVTRTIYERRDMTFAEDDRYIPRANVGGYEIIDSYGEFHNLLSDWSGPNTNDNIDAFIVQAINIGGGVDGVDGSIPGPTSHSGGDSGVIASKTGFVDAHGNRRLHSDYLGMLIGHELGHYLGLQHTSDAGNLMLPSSGTTDTNLTYSQYKTMIQHGWVEID